MADDDKQSKNEFGTVEKVLAVIKPMEDIERIRASDRAKVDNLFNGKRPYTPDEEEKNQIPVNVNWGMGKRIMRDANNQVNSALLHPGILFNCALEAGEIDKRDEWSAKFTKNIHIPLQRGKSGKRHASLVRNRNASICMHGIGALLWVNPFRWIPRFVPMEDLLIPTETYSDFSNLRYFAVNQYLTPGELIDMTQGDKVKPGWNKPMVDKILKAMKNMHSEGVPPTWRDQPEAMTNVWKENRGYYYSDAVPKIRLRWFFYQKIDEPKQWYRLMILREAYGDVKPSTGFVFDGNDEPFADDIDEILNVQYGDNNFVPPLKYHAVRGLGVDLFAPVEELNRLFCEFIWAVHVDFRILFKIKDPADRDRLKQIVLSQFGTIPEGMEMLKRDERYQIEPRLFEEAAAQMRQVLQESSASFVQDHNDGTEKQMTAKEATIRLNQTNVMVSAMLQSLYFQEGFYYEQLVRRFCRKDSADPEVKEFRKACIKDGIPEDLLVAENWRVMPERVLGGGDKTQAQQEAMWLWANKTQFDPGVQAKIGRLVVGTLLGDFNKATELVPQAKIEATEGVMAAENVFGTLMQGQQCVMRQGIDQQGYITTLLRMMGAVVQRILTSGGTGQIDEVIGLGVVAQNISQHIMVLAADKKQKPLVKQYGDALGQILNQLKGIAQRLMEQRQSQQEAAQGNPQDAAKAQSMLMLAKTKAQIAQANALLKQQQKKMDFALDQQRQNLQLAAEIERENQRHHTDLMHQNMQHFVDTLHEVRAMNSDHQQN